MRSDAANKTRSSMSMDLTTMGERVFAAEFIQKKRTRKVNLNTHPRRAFNESDMYFLCNFACIFWVVRPVVRGRFIIRSPCLVYLQGRSEYLVKWKGWSLK